MIIKLFPFILLYFQKIRCFDLNLDYGSDEYLRIRCPNLYFLVQVKDLHFLSGIRAISLNPRITYTIHRSGAQSPQPTSRNPLIPKKKTKSRNKKNKTENMREMDWEKEEDGEQRYFFMDHRIHQKLFGKKNWDFILRGEGIALAEKLQEIRVLDPLGEKEIPVIIDHFQQKDETSSPEQEPDFSSSKKVSPKKSNGENENIDENVLPLPGGSSSYFTKPRSLESSDENLGSIGGGSIRAVIPAHDEEDFLLCGELGLPRDCDIDRRGNVKGCGMNFLSEKYRGFLLEKLRKSRSLVEEEHEKGIKTLKKEFLWKEGGDNVYLISYDRWTARLEYNEEKLDRFLDKNKLQDGEAHYAIRKIRNTNKIYLKLIFLLYVNSK